MVVPHIEFETDHVTDALCRPATIGKTFWVWTLLEKLNNFCDLGIIEPSWASGREGRFKRPSFAEANSPNAHSTGFDAKMLSNGSGRPLGIIQEGLRRETTFFELLPGKPSRLPHLRHAWSLPTSLPTLHVIYKCCSAPRVCGGQRPRDDPSPLATPESSVPRCAHRPLERTLLLHPTC